MKFIKRLPLDGNNVTSNRFAVEANDTIVTTSKKSIQLPSGATADRPSPVNGQVRYNTTLNDSEIYNIAGTGTGWEKVRTNRQQTITPQNLGVGNYLNTLFGPLTYDVATTKPENVFVFVDNVYQIPTTNYTLIAGTNVAKTAQTVGAVAFGNTNLTLNTTTNVIVGQLITAATGIAASTTVTNVNVNTRVITLSIPTTSLVPSGTTCTFSYQSGTYVEFTGAVPAKQVFCLLGFDGYSPL